MRHGQPQAVTDRGEQLQRFAIGAGAAAQAFAINRQGLENGDFLSHHPLSDAQVKLGGIQAVEHPEEGAVARRTAAARLGVWATTQRPQLALRELAALILKSLIGGSTGAWLFPTGAKGIRNQL